MWAVSLFFLPVSDSILLQDLLGFLFALFGEAEAFVTVAVDDEFLFAEFVEGVPVVGFPGEEKPVFVSFVLSLVLLSSCLCVFYF